MRRTLAPLIFLLLYTSVSNSETLDTRVTNLGYGFQEVSATETDGKFRYLYFGDRKLGKLGNYSISPSGNYVAFQDKPAGNLYLFRTTDKTMEQLTKDYIAPAKRYSWNETLEFVEIKFTGIKETMSFAIE